MVRGITDRVPRKVAEGALKLDSGPMTTAAQGEPSFLTHQNLEALQKASISSRYQIQNRLHGDICPSDDWSTLIVDEFSGPHGTPTHTIARPVLTNDSQKASTETLLAVIGGVLEEFNVANRDEISRVLSTRVTCWLSNHAPDHRASTQTISWTDIQDEMADDASISSGAPSDSPQAVYRDRYLLNGLAPSFKMRKGPRFFQPGRIFEILWNEAAGPPIENGPHTPESGMIIGPRGQRIYSQLRTLVVFQNKKGYCLCFICGTHGGRGTARPGLTQDMIDAHTILYDCFREPYMLDKEPPFAKKPLSARLVNGTTLDPRMRLNFGKIHTVNWNVRVKRIGHICCKHMSRFKAYAEETILRG